MTLDYTPQQIDIINAAEKGTRNIAINSVAGSGKTSTLIGIAHRVREGIFLAFQSDIVAELNERLKGTGLKAKTIHAIGLGSMYRAGYRLQQNVDEFKYYRLVKHHVDANFYFRRSERRERDNLQSAIHKMIRFGRENLIEPHDKEGILATGYEYDLFMNRDQKFQDAVVEAYSAIIHEGRRLLMESGAYDFADMLYFPVMNDLQPYQYRFVMMDEVQDFSTARLEFALKVVKEGGKVIGSGDPFQSIYAFAGANVNSFENFVNATDAQQFPLSVSMRCPKSHVQRVKHIVPHMEARSDAPEGIIRRENKKVDLASLVRGREHEIMLVSRFTAPLVNAGIRLLQQGIRVQIMGRDLDNNLIDILNAIELEPDYQFGNLISLVERYKVRQTEYLMQRENGVALSLSMQDRCEAVMVCIQLFQPKTMNELKNKIADLLDPKRPGVRGGVIHRVKGLESKVVIMIDPEDCPYEDERMTLSQMKQEYHCFYVANTRATSELILIGNEPPMFRHLFDKPKVDIKVERELTPLLSANADEETQEYVKDIRGRIRPYNAKTGV